MTDPLAIALCAGAGLVGYFVGRIDEYSRQNDPRRLINIDPRGYKSMNFPDPEPEREATNPYTGQPQKPQFPRPRITLP